LKNAFFEMEKIKKLSFTPGPSCREQIFDGTGRKALHPAEILLAAL
jgi:hypothetical protein